MRTLIVYFSLEGNTKYAAEQLAEKTGADTLRLVPKKAYADKGFAKFFWGGKSAIMAEKPELEPYDVRLSDYDRVVFGFPVWASNFAPPIRSFVTENSDALKDKEIFAFACQAGSGGEKALSRLSALLGKEFGASAVFTDPLSKKESSGSDIDAFSKKLL